MAFWKFTRITDSHKGRRLSTIMALIVRAGDEAEAKEVARDWMDDADDPNEIDNFSCSLLSPDGLSEVVLADVNEGALE